MAVELKDTKTSNRPSSLTNKNQHIKIHSQNHHPHHDSASESAFIGSWGSSSSSFLTTPFESELDSNETDNDEDEFMAELTRQMADYMLQEDDYNSDNDKTASLEKPISQVYQVENQPRVGEWVRRGKVTESTQQMEFYRGGRGYPNPGVGSGMRAIFLDGSGSRNAVNGTGVFLPRSATGASIQSRKKPGYSTALVPTRVLQALEQHFNNMESLSSANSLSPAHPNHHGENDSMPQKLQVHLASSDHLETELPQEWTY